MIKKHCLNALAYKLVIEYDLSGLKQMSKTAFTVDYLEQMYM